MMSATDSVYDIKIMIKEKSHGLSNFQLLEGKFYSPAAFIFAGVFGMLIHLFQQLKILSSYWYVYLQ